MRKFWLPVKMIERGINRGRKEQSECESQYKAYISSWCSRPKTSVPIMRCFLYFFPAAENTTHMTLIVHHQHEDADDKHDNPGKADYHLGHHMSTLGQTISVTVHAAGYCISTGYLRCIDQVDGLSHRIVHHIQQPQDIKFPTLGQDPATYVCISRSTTTAVTGTKIIQLVMMPCWNASPSTVSRLCSHMTTRLTWRITT
ncbi:hypothetical protein QBC37DRAFT_8095 [Rhypophila decipiens]|uniref:Uncharacterized protein n=1 Tax=Rhypophila decipiens TaxID=261697 RepID=A0AAN6YGH0_9PEZI|nr:hypothetical protein QBC37DRAFT_8095 [Rhypophila decipiens]